MGTLHSALVALIGFCVLVFVVAWAVGAVYFGIKSRTGLSGLRRTLPRRVVLMLGAVVFVTVIRRFPDSFWHHLEYWQPELALVGALLAVVSTALLLWARWVLGTMWASVPTVQEHHELRTDGPYRLVRHPIYTGILGLVTGAMLASGFGVWIVVLAAAVPWLLWRVRAEDGLMAGRFGAEYEAYRARVPALIPWSRAIGSRRPRTDADHGTRPSRPDRAGR